MGNNAKPLIETARKKIPVLAGPNLVVLPRDLPPFMPNMQQTVYLHPSEWCVNVWKDADYRLSPLDFWPTGIDMNTFPFLRDKPDPNTVMIYIKKRPQQVLDSIIKVVEENNLKYKLIIYGSYNEQQYKDAIAASAFGIWAGTTESQGIGLQESLTAGLPLIVIDNKSVFDHYIKNKYIFPETVRADIATSAPYFDDRCGVIIDSLVQLDSTVKKMKQNYVSYKPREYIAETLSLEKSAERLLNLFNKIDFEKYPNGKAVPDEPYKEMTYSFGSRLHFSIFVLRRKMRTAKRLLQLKRSNVNS